MLKITFLGTGTSQGVPVITCQCRVCLSTDPRDARLRSSLMIETGTEVLVIDSGPDFRQQMLREKVGRVDAILITHDHKDHVGGLDDIRPFNFSQDQAMRIYANARSQEAIRRDFPYVFAENKYPGVPQMKLMDIDSAPFTIDNTQITPIEVMHYKLPVKAFRVHDFTYITDASYISNSEKEKIKGTKVLVVNALRRKTHLSHFNLEEALELISEIQPQKAYLTHLSHHMGLYTELENELPANVQVAYDGLKIDV